ncbi:MAG: TolC family protein [Pseudoalteromonas sp.]|uniref:TolC family protein n=1 Tax=unclassified Pseudoalteromonas TaxID=194690 RepID=UPI003F976E0D
MKIRFFNACLRKYIAFGCTLFLAANVHADEPLKLSEALSKALTEHPQLQSYPYKLRALEGEQLQASLTPNPELGVELENVLGTGSRRGLEAGQLTVTLGQLIELGDKQNQRIAVSKQKHQEAMTNYKIARLNVLTDTADKFYQVLKWQQLIAWNEQKAEKTSDLLATIKQRAAAGAVSNADVSRIAFQLAQVKLSGISFQGELKKARYELSQMWLAQPNFSHALNAQQAISIPSEISWQEAVNQAPNYLLLAQQVRLKQAELALAQANNVTDIKLNAGLRYDALSDDSSMVLGFSMPLNWQDPNQGTVAMADAKLAGLTQQQAVLRRAIRAQAASIHTQMEADQAIALTLQNNLLAQAKQMLHDSEVSYQNGQISVLQLLDAQHALFNSQRQLIELRISQQKNLVAMQRLTGRSLVSNLASKRD